MFYGRGVRDEDDVADYTGKRGCHDEDVSATELFGCDCVDDCQSGREGIRWNGEKLGVGGSVAERLDDGRLCDLLARIPSPVLETGIGHKAYQE